MKYNLDRVIRFEAEPKYKSLYPWALQEVGEGGKTGPDQIPWTLSHSFVATELTLLESSAAKSEYATKTTWIRAKLTPGMERRGQRPAYSMFGTDRTVEQIQLFIHRIESEDERPANAVWATGFPSYTDEDPLWGETAPDLLQFDLSLVPEEFDRIAERVAANQVDSATFRCNAHGFYADWTPDIETDEFKVLCAPRKEQMVELPDGCEVDPPRLGEVWDATFSIQRVVQPRLVVEQAWKEAADEEYDYADDWQDEPASVPPPDPLWVKPILVELRGVKILMGVVAALVALGLVFK